MYYRVCWNNKYLFIWLFFNLQPAGDQADDHPEADDEGQQQSQSQQQQQRHGDHQQQQQQQQQNLILQLFIQQTMSSRGGPSTGNS